MDLGLAGKVAFIAGSSRGIGFAIAEAFLREGARVVITGRKPESLNRARSALAGRFEERNIASVTGDMTQESDISTALDFTLASLGGLDAVVANVGSGRESGGWDVGLDNWETSLRTNLLGSMALARSALAHLTQREAGTLTFISSIAGIEAINAPVAYSSAKAGVLSAMKSLSRLVGSKGVRVNAVLPGNVLFPGGTWERKLVERREFFEDYIRTEVPLGRFGRPDEIADTVVFLASERASFITGSCLVVDGGQTHSV